MLQQFVALFGALPARLCAFGHVFFRRNLPAGRCAFGAAFLAALQHVSCQRAFSSAQSRTRLAALGAVGAQLGRLAVFLFAIGQQCQTVLETRVTFELTTGAGRSALREVLVVFMLSTGGRAHRLYNGHDQCGRK
jgi:hypothetical protein